MLTSQKGHTCELQPEQYSRSRVLQQDSLLAVSASALVRSSHFSPFLQPPRFSSSFSLDWPIGVFLTKKYLDFAHFYRGCLFDLFQYTIGNSCVFCMAKGRVTCRGNSAGAWTQDSNSSTASGRIARGKAL